MTTKRHSLTWTFDSIPIVCNGHNAAMPRYNNGAAYKDLLWLTWVLPPEITDTSVEQVSPHSAELIQQMAAGDVIGIPEGLRLQVLETTKTRWENVVWKKKKRQEKKVSPMDNWGPMCMPCKFVHIKRFDCGLAFFLLHDILATFENRFQSVIFGWRKLLFGRLNWQSGVLENVVMSWPASPTHQLKPWTTLADYQCVFVLICIKGSPSQCRFVAALL